MRLDHGFERAFDPRAVAVVGVSRSADKKHPGYSGLQFLRMLRGSGYKGQVCPVNPKADEIEGVRAYPSLAAVPEPLDLVIVTVPPASVPGVLEDCAAAGALNVHICTAGFGETGEAEGRGLDEVMREIALREGLRVVGPNCMGLHVPSVGLRMYEGLPLLQGPVAFLSQSGSLVHVFIAFASTLGVGCSKAISYGNALVMDAPDFLEYLATDPETQVICMYLEGIKDGRRLTELVRRITPQKPVIVWKSGLTESGARASASHTGSLAGDRQIWDAFFRQSGAIRVGSVGEMADLAMTFLRLRPSVGFRAAVLASGGGSNVASGDICGEEGLDVPAPSPETRARLMDFVPLINQSVVNPMDVPGVLTDIRLLKRALEILAADPVINIILLHPDTLLLGFIRGKSAEAIAELGEYVSDFARQNRDGKPIVAAMQPHEMVVVTEGLAQELREAGITVYSSLSRACRALNRFAGYYSSLAEGGEGAWPRRSPPKETSPAL